MGYETRLYVGYRYSFTQAEKHETIGMIGMVELCKCCYGKFEEVIELSHDDKMPLAGIYGTDGSTIIEEDFYGQKLRLVPLENVLKAMKLDNAREKYRRFTYRHSISTGYSKGL